MTLDELAIKHGTDKSSLHHNYCEVYEKYFAPLREKNILLFELGVGGYASPSNGGNSLRMWCEYFKYGRVISVDKFDKSGIEVPDNGLVKQVSQDDTAIKHLMFERPHIVIDDASHINPLTIKSFEIIFPILNSGAIYVIEDAHTSYWDTIAIDGTNFHGGHHEATVMNYFKRLADEINMKEDCMIESIHFYKQMIFIFKK